MAERTITNDLEYLIEKAVDHDKADYAVITGIQVRALRIRSHNQTLHYTIMEGGKARKNNGFRQKIPGRCSASLKQQLPSIPLQVHTWAGGPGDVGSTAPSLEFVAPTKVFVVVSGINVSS